MSKENAFDALAVALEVLPNIGPKSAQRIAYHLLQNNRQGAEILLASLDKALKQVKHCQLCNTLCEDDYCEVCLDENRDHSILMIVQMPLDVSVIESSHCYNGLYFILMGAIQPIQKIDLNGIAIQKLLERLKSDEIKEVIIGTNFNAEGETTAFILQELLKNTSLKVSRLARGIPLGGELEFVDLGTIAQAFYDRKIVEGDK